MTDILERAKTVQRESATAATLSIRLAFLEDLISEIEALRRQVGPTTLKAIRDKQEDKQ